MLGTRPTAVSLDGDRRNITKTPGRALAKPRSALQENACRDVPMTVNAKGKKVIHNTPLPLRTLQTDRVLKDAPAKQTQVSKLRETPLIRPLGDKTPFPNRTANQVVPPSFSSKTNPTLLDGSLRTSSTRKHDRLPRSASKTFETPVTSGNHWDVSDIDIEIGGVVANQSLEEEDYDEVEYMPPKVEDVSYEPPFELPNYREVGKTLIALIRSFPLDDNPPTVPSFSNEVLESKNDELPLPSIESDDLFVEVKGSVKAPESVPSLRNPQKKSEFRNLTITKTAACVSCSTVPTLRKLSAMSTHRLPPTGPSRPAQSTSRPPSACIPSSARATSASSVLRSRSVAPSHTSTTSTRTTSLTLNKSSITRNAGTTKGTASGRAQPRFRSNSKPPPSSMSKPTSRIGNGVPGTPKDLEGLIIFEDTWDIEEFRFDV